MRFYVETTDTRYTIEAHHMEIDGDTVRFVDQAGGEWRTVLAIRGWIICGVADARVLQAIEAKGASHAQ